MTPAKVREVAEKIIKALEQEHVPNYCVEWIVPIIAEAIQESILDDRMARTADEIYQLSYKRGKNEAFEEAAKFVETYRERTVGELRTYYLEDEVLADKIRALKETLQ